MEELFSALSRRLELAGKEINQLSPLVLAYIGDAVYEVFVRAYVIREGNMPVHKLHKRATDFVKAKAQSDTIHRLMEHLAAEEQDVVRRGRNAKSGTVPKNADVVEYKHATGFESLIGYLYLKKDITRLMEIFELTLPKK